MVYSILKDHLGMGYGDLWELQKKAERIAVLAGKIAQEVAKKRSIDGLEIFEIECLALIYRAVHPENEGIYNGSEEFDKEKNANRAMYSIKIAEEKGIELNEVQKKALMCEASLAHQIIKLAETIIATQYIRVYNGKCKGDITDPVEIVTTLLLDSAINLVELINLVGDDNLIAIINEEMGLYEEFVRRKKEHDIMRYIH